MLRPQDTMTRETKRLDGIWDFVVDDAGVGRQQRWWERPLAAAQKMPVPSSYNDVLVDAAVHDHVGDVWYQRTVFVPAAGPECAPSSGSMPPPIGPGSGSTTWGSSNTKGDTRHSKST